MENKMFCFQCEQTAGCTGCTGNAGVCGKKVDTANLQDELTGTLVSLAAAVSCKEELMSHKLHCLVTKGLFATLTNVNFDNESITQLINEIHGVSQNMESVQDYDMSLLWNADEDIRSWSGQGTGICPFPGKREDNIIICWL